MADKTQERLIDELLKDYSNPESLWRNRLILTNEEKKQSTMEAKMDNHLGYTKHDPKSKNIGNSRNGRGKKTLIIDSKLIGLEPLRDQNG